MEIQEPERTGGLVDEVTGRVIAYRGEGLWDTDDDNEPLVGIIDSWNQSDRTLRDIDNNILTHLPDGYMPSYGLPGFIISNEFDTPDEQEMLEEYNRRVQQQNESQESSPISSISETDEIGEIVPNTRRQIDFDAVERAVESSPPLSPSMRIATGEDFTPPLSPINSINDEPFEID